MEVLFELLFEFFGEVILQVVFEALAEVGIHLRRDAQRDPESRSAWRLVLGYPLLGAILGGLSLLLFPNSLAHAHAARIATFLLAPVAAGLAMVALGAWRARHGQQRNSLDRFVYAYLLALGMAAVRYVWAA